METKTYAVRLCRYTTKSCLTFVVKALTEEEAHQKALDEFPFWVVLSATLVYGGE